MVETCQICGEEWSGILGVGFSRCRICRRLVCDRCKVGDMCKICQEKRK